MCSHLMATSEVNGSRLPYAPISCGRGCFDNQYPRGILGTVQFAGETRYQRCGFFGAK